MVITSSPLRAARIAAARSKPGFSGRIVNQLRLLGEGKAGCRNGFGRGQKVTLNRGAAGVLAFGALGGIVAMLWPFFPGLLKIAPLAAVLAVVAWLMVAGRLRNSGLEEFVEALQATAETDDGESTPAA